MQRIDDIDEITERESVVAEWAGHTALRWHRASRTGIMDLKLNCDQNRRPDEGMRSDLQVLRQIRICH